MSQYFPPYESFRRNIKVELDLRSYATKTDLKMKHVDISSFDKLATNVDNIDSAEFVLKSKYDTGKSDLEKKNSDVDEKAPDSSKWFN